MTRVRVADIVIDAGTQVRASIDESTVTAYAERMAEGDAFPPVVLFHDGNGYYLGDGFHRTLAAQRNQWREIDADVRAGTTQDALWFALGANRTNGLRLTEADKSHAILLALTQWPERLHTEIAAQVGCSESLVSKVKASPRFTGESGRQALTGRALQNHTKRVAVRALVEQGGMERDEIAKKADVSVAFVSKVRAEMGAPSYDRTREGLVRRRARMRQMAADGYSSRQIAEAVGMTCEGCREALSADGVDVPADRVVKGLKRHDANRIVDQIVADAENLTEGVNLITFADLHRDRLAGWVTSLQESRDKLGAFIRKLMKEQQHGEAA